MIYTVSLYCNGSFVPSYRIINFINKIQSCSCSSCIQASGSKLDESTGKGKQKRSIFTFTKAELETYTTWEILEQIFALM